MSATPTDRATAPTIGYRAELDGLRALAVAAVIGYHAGVPGFSGGHVGVIWFFVLSGFLITTLLLEERQRHGEIGLKRFYQRRAMRLLPTLYLVLAVFFVLSITIVTIDNREFVSAGLYFSNMHPLVFGVGASQAFFLHTWSLSLEEQFYLVWPIVIGRLAFKRTAVCLGLAFGVIAIAFVSRFFLEDEQTYLTLPIFTMDGFVIGALLAAALRAGRIRQWFTAPMVVASACLVMVLDVIISHSVVPVLTPVRMLASQVAIAVVIVALVSNRRSGLATVLRGRAFVYVGLLSYALYLWHFPIFELFTADRLPDMTPWLRHVLKYTLSIVCAVATYHLIERPLTKRRARLRAVSTEKRSVSVRREHSVPPMPLP